MKHKLLPIGLLLGLSRCLINLDEAFELFQKKYKKVYASAEERSMRKQVFIEKYKMVQKLNLKTSNNLYNMVLLGSAPKAPPPVSPDKFEVGYFADKFPKELESYVSPPGTFKDVKLRFAVVREDQTPQNTLTRIKKMFGLRSRNLQTTPMLKRRVDWTSLSRPAKSQDRCQACYAFSTNSLVESWYQKLTGQAVDLSVQEIVTCSLETSGCENGLPFKVLDYIIVNGITYSYYYPFEGNTTTTCKVDLSSEYLQMVRENNLANEAAPPVAARRLEGGSTTDEAISEAPSGQGPKSSLSNRLLSPQSPPNNAPRAASEGSVQTAKAERKLEKSFDPLFAPGRASFSPSQPMDFSYLISQKKLQVFPRFKELVGYEPLRPGIINLLKKLQEGPVAVLIQAPEALMFLSKDVIYQGEGCDPKKEPNHSIVIYAYDLDAEVPYLYFKNSWPDVWADKGYGKIAVGPIKEFEWGVCGLAITSLNFVPVFKGLN